MRELLRTNNAVLLSLTEAVLAEAGIGCFVADRNFSSVEGSIGAFPRRVLVADAELAAARRALIAAGVAPDELSAPGGGL